MDGCRIIGSPQFCYMMLVVMLCCRGGRISASLLHNANANAQACGDTSRAQTSPAIDATPGHNATEWALYSMSELPFSFVRHPLFVAHGRHGLCRTLCHRMSVGTRRRYRIDFLSRDLVAEFRSDERDTNLDYIVETQHLVRHRLPRRPTSRPRIAPTIDGAVRSSSGVVYRAKQSIPKRKPPSPLPRSVTMAVVLRADP